ncbi:MAG: LPXTG cell wall anchor domain-containing protein [Lachnospiraceae bacterium]|nr:LPXTG cell wall anchor domain-containing protein [Lachnospiraceae bacterium]
MKNKAKLFSAFLAVMLLISAFSVFAFADGGTTTLTAHVPCTVTLQIGEHGSVTVDGTKYIGDASFQKDPDTVVAYTITPDSGYEINSVLYNGESVTSSVSGGVYTAPALTGNVTLIVLFTSTAPAPTKYPHPGGGDYMANYMGRSPKTGDESHVALWIALLCASGAGIAALMISKRKRKAK